MQSETSLTRHLLSFAWFSFLTVAISVPSLAQAKPDCPGLPTASRLKQVLQSVVKQGPSKNGGMGNQEWAVLVNREGVGCAVVYSGTTASQEWPASRVIASSKANTANGVSNDDYAISTANLFAPSQPGESLYSTATSGPPNPKAVFGDPGTFGTSNDPMIGKLVGGVIVFGGGLALYNGQGKVIGGLGLSGDTSCTDHIIAWKVRHELELDNVTMGPSPGHNDNMILDFHDGKSPSGFGHPLCKGGMDPQYIIQSLSKKFPTGHGHK
jgi:uncharacterized protein GlcG (DUF336 family)